MRRGRLLPGQRRHARELGGVLERLELERAEYAQSGGRDQQRASGRLLPVLLGAGHVGVRRRRLVRRYASGKLVNARRVPRRPRLS
jgi:hypothetical protein